MKCLKTHWLGSTKHNEVCEQTYNLRFSGIQIRMWLKAEYMYLTMSWVIQFNSNNSSNSMRGHNAFPLHMWIHIK